MPPRQTAVDPSKGVLEVEWQLFGELSRALALKVSREFDPELVVGIANAGVIPGATIASILDRRSDYHKVELSRHLSPLDATTVAGLERLTNDLADRGLDPQAAEIAARHILDRMLESQAMMEAFHDAFAFMAMLFLVLLPLAVLMPKDMPGKTPKAE